MVGQGALEQLPVLVAELAEISGGVVRSLRHADGGKINYWQHLPFLDCNGRNRPEIIVSGRGISSIQFRNFQLYFAIYVNPVIIQIQNSTMEGAQIPMQQVATEVTTLAAKFRSKRGKSSLPLTPMP